MEERQSDRQTLEGMPLTAQQVYNGVVCGGAYALVCDLRSKEEYKKGFIPTAIHIPVPPASSDSPRSKNNFAAGWPKSLADLEAAVKDDEVKKRLGQRSLRCVILYEGGCDSGGSGDDTACTTTTKPSAWQKHVCRLFRKDGKAMRVSTVQGGYRAWLERYPFAVQSDWDAPFRSYPSEIISGRLFLGTLPQALDEKVMTDLKISHVVNAANSIGRETFASTGVQYFYVDVEDQEDTDLSVHFNPAFKFISDAIGHDTIRTGDGQHVKNENRVLLHCQLGVSRSATLCIYYVMCKQRTSLVRAYDLVRKARPQIYPNLSFRSQLRLAEIGLFHKASVSEEALEYLGEDGCQLENEERGRHPCCIM